MKSIHTSRILWQFGKLTSGRFVPVGPPSPRSTLGIIMVIDSGLAYRAGRLASFVFQVCLQRIGKPDVIEPRRLYNSKYESESENFHIIS